LFHYIFPKIANISASHQIIRVQFHLTIDCDLFIGSLFFSIFLLREQFLINDRQWLKRMISHHSTALTTSHKIKKKTQQEKIKKLAGDIIEAQEREIKMMKKWLREGI